MKVYNSLIELEEYFLKEKERGIRIAIIYEAVQEAPNVLQRLYLMIIAGSAFVKSKETGVKEILKDLIEMVKSIQNPIKGLFLRYFMLKKLKEIFPDKTNQNDR